MDRLRPGDIGALDVMQLSSTLRHDKRTESLARAGSSAFADSIDEPRRENGRPPVLVFDALAKSYGKTVVVDHLSLTLKRSEVFGFLGPNGAGKTSTIRMICGLARPTGGSGTLLGFDIWRDRAEIRSHLGYVPQQFRLYPDLTVLENLCFFASAYGVQRRAANCRIQTLISQLGLFSFGHIRAGDLSDGLKQLAAIVCAILHKPALLVLDEPTSSLDPCHRQTVWNLLYQLSREGTTIFVTTHYMEEADRCTKVGLLYGGKLLAFGSPSQLKERLADHILDFDVDPIIPAHAAIQELPGVFGTRVRSGKIRLFARDPGRLATSLREHWPFPGLTWRGYEFGNPDMDDVFEALISTEGATGVQAADVRMERSGAPGVNIYIDPAL